jgi:putative nucleotidyltransferase with HDIG domain
MRAIPRQPPRLIARALIASFFTVALILIGVFVLISLDVRKRVRQSVEQNLNAAQQLFAQVESRRDQDMRAAVSTLAESPTLKATVDTWQAERRKGESLAGEAASTVQNEARKIAARVDADVLIVLDARGRVITSAGPLAAAFVPGEVMTTAGSDQDTVVVRPAGAFRVMEVPLLVNDTQIGSLELGTALDNNYAQEMRELARAHIVIMIGDKVAATTLDDQLTGELARRGPIAAGAQIMELGGESWLVRHVNTVGPATFLALASIDAAAGAETRAALMGLLSIVLISLVLGGAGSWWLARTLTRPIDQLSASLTAMSSRRHHSGEVPATGTSRELDALTHAFNTMIRSVAAAEAETQAAYLGAIRALAAALDARDPYTSGHSERVSALSVEIGRTMQLTEADLDILRLGALLHDIGKIGVPDEVLRKPSALTASEFELIRAHPVIGARILRSIPFLAAHLPIVELHHERPDGRGYPYGLTADAIPMTARIVHVADAYDAMTSARAYRPGRLPHEALSEIQREVGSDFDRLSVEGLLSALPKMPTASAGFDPAAFQWAGPIRTQAS